MPLDPEATKVILDRLSDEFSEATLTAPPSRDRVRVERDGQKVTVTRLFRLEVSVNGENERVQTTLDTGDGRRSEMREDLIPRDKAQFRALAIELIQPLMSERG